MASKAGNCSICQKPLGKDSKREVTTACKHTFHRDCAQQRFIKGKSNDCPICREISALEHALMGDTMTTNKQRDSDQRKNTKNNEKAGHVASSMMKKSHSSDTNAKDKSVDEWECSSCSVDNPASSKRCESCNKPKHSSSFVNSPAASAFEETYDQRSQASPHQRSGRHSDFVEEDSDEDHPTTNRQQWDKQEIGEWTCDQCDYVNRGSGTVCKNCRQEKHSENVSEQAARKLHRPLPPVHHSPGASSSSSKSVSRMYPELDDDSYSSSHDRQPKSKVSSTSTSSTKDMPSSEFTHGSSSKPKSSKEKTQPSTPSTPKPVQHRIPVYISGLPLDVEDDRQLASHIRRRVEKALRFEPGDIKCYSKLGAGVMYVSSNDIKDHLINEIGDLMLHPKEGKHTISFVDTLELVSYIVLDVPKEKSDLALPSTGEISRRWVELCKGEKPLGCEQLNIQFPNIYRIVTTSLDELIDNLHHQDVKIKNQFARIYFCADCSFLEDLPRSITHDQLQTAIADTIKQPHISSSSLYIQLNKQAGNACIIAADTARKWAAKSYLYLGDKAISKKENLVCRLLVHPVPSTLSPTTILNHSDFTGKATIYKHSGESLVLEISDKNIFDECVKRGALRIANKHTLNMDPYSASNNPDGSEIDGDTWYDTEMSKYKPDIMQFVANPEHAIFRYKWNSKIWLQQFDQTTPEKFSVDFPKNPRGQRGTTIDQIRHQLQVTVMLNTLATIRKKSYSIKDREVKLNLKNAPKTIVYNHQSILEKGGKMPIKSPPFPKTTVQVLEVDCVVAYEQLVTKGKRPLLLNMASATSPGGGFRKGDGAQEENLFRRSDYFRSLDVGLDDFLPQRSERFRCSSDGRLEPLPEPHTMYPIDEYSAVYTSGLTFFRHSQDVGYEYLDKPIENVSGIAMAAYRDPKLEGKLLSSKYAVGTRKKIENVFSIAYHHKHDSLVLSAFGCGAFRNPPGHVAKLFSSVIDQYAGFFDTIVFAIVDDHNAGQRLNPEGNYKPFADILDRKIATPFTPMNKPNTMFGPYRLSSDGSTVSDVCIFDLTPCYYGGKCSDVSNANHTRQYSHPPICIYAAFQGKCDSENDIVHTTSFIHQNQCPYGGECRHIDEKKHTQELAHPSAYCPQAGNCRNMEADHLKQFRHLPLCEQEEKCLEYRKHVKKHCESFRHCQRLCLHGNYCVNFHDKKHMDEKKHPFPPPCPRTPFHCIFHTAFSEATDTRNLSIEIQQHCLDYAHVCRFGRNCMDNSLLHREKTIHIVRNLCPYDGKCIKLNQEEHLNSYTHSNIADIRRVCKYTDKCYELRKLDHTVKFRHARSHEDSGVVRYHGLNNDINFVQNQSNSMSRVFDYVKNQNWKPLPSNNVPRDILDWFRTVKPVHRCNPVIFESILLHGHVMSRDYMENLKKTKFVANSVMQHTRVRRIEKLHISQYAQHAREYITAIVTCEFDKANFPPSDPGPDGSPAPLPRPASASHPSRMKSKEKVLLSANIPQTDLDALKAKAVEIAQASINLFSNPAGIGHAPDKALGTDKHIFSILGPHLGHYYGDVFIVFKREILHHPDADFSMQAATTFGSGNAYKWRPWLGPDPGTIEERIEQYHNSKLHASIPGYEYAIALELMAITSYDLKLKSMDMDLQTIFKRWLQTDSHRTIEAHLPELIPLDYIDHIYIPQNIFDSLSASARKSINAVFKYCITVTPHQGDANQEMGPFGPTPTSKERVDYQTYVVDELLKIYDRDVHNPPARPIQGAIITIPASTFDDSIVLPLTISQAYEQYRIEKQKDPPGNIAYIYWQAINGDMMLVISSEPIDSEKDQTKLRYLLCYIAPTCVSHDSGYMEQATYLHYGQPIQHHGLVGKNQYTAKSNTFHIGSNTDDHITYCLEIHRATGKVILRQAGSNAIYNHQEIVAEFTQKELDITKLDFIHLTAGTKTVSVRNLIVCCEKQADLHPTFDKDFKKSDASPPVASSGDHSHHSSTLKPCSDNVNCLLQYATGASGTAHNSTFSHPCRFSELCRNKDKEPHLTHDPHPSPLCDYDKKCNKVVDPFHRAACRHTDLPDFLVPCRVQSKCQDKSNVHRIKYSHGEQVFGKKGADAASSSSEYHKTDHRYPCKYGSECRTMGDANHQAKYSHHKSD